MEKETPTQNTENALIDDSNAIDQEGYSLVKEFLHQNIDHVLIDLTDLHDLDAFEVILKLPNETKTEIFFHSGQLNEIWTINAYIDIKNIMHKTLIKGEERVFNLPNQRTKDLNPILGDKAFGQVVCLPILLRNKPIGMVCIAHTRKKFLSDKETVFFHSLTEWIAG